MDKIQDELLDTEFYVYNSGLCYMSVCVIATMETYQIEAMANRANPTVEDREWTITDEPFKTGEPNPCKCDNDPANRKHYLLSC
jgi:hypothetical protein